MYVRIVTEFVWYGTNRWVDSVGPFSDSEAASKWNEEYRRFVPAEHKEDSQVVEVAEKLHYSADRTPRQVFDAIWENINKICMG